eukprot:4271204-Pyramimonas_sp.AAC.1
MVVHGGVTRTNSYLEKLKAFVGGIDGGAQALVARRLAPLRKGASAPHKEGPVFRVKQLAARSGGCSAPWFHAGVTIRSPLAPSTEKKSSDGA